MKRLIIHVGHGKTGTSYLQSILTLNREILRESDIYYPIGSRDRRAYLGHVSTGNGNFLVEKNIANTDCGTILISSEMLFRKLINDDEWLRELVNEFNLEIILYVRNVIEHSVSIWGQGVKKGKIIEDVDTYLLNTPRDNVLRHVLKWISKSKELNFKLSLTNYSTCRRFLVTDFLSDKIRIEAHLENLSFPKIKIINRGLMFSEYEIQRVFNSMYGNRCVRYVSDFLVNTFPDACPEVIKIKSSSYEKILKANLDLVAQINECLSEENQLEIGKKEDWVDDNKIQALDTAIVRGLGESILNLTRTSLDGEELNDLRDIALRLYDMSPALAKDALTLMRIVSRARPKGPLIQQKIEEWTSGNFHER